MVLLCHEVFGHNIIVFLKKHSIAKTEFCLEFLKLHSRPLFFFSKTWFCMSMGSKTAVS